MMEEEIPDVFSNNDDDLHEHYRFVVDPGQGLLRIDKFLMDRIENSSRTKIQSAASNGNILVNDEQVKSSYKVKPGDIIRILMEEPVRDIELIQEDIPLDIVHEDEDLLVINKAAGIVVHPAYGNYTGTLVNALMFHLNGQGNGVSENLITPYLVHRIDKDTSGLLVVAKNEIAQRNLQDQFFHHTIHRRYHALVWGELKEDEGTITGNIARSKSDRKIFTVYEDDSIGKRAVTHYKVLERFGYVTLVECALETGRTHQIRVHMRYLGHPLFNDETYGGNRILRGTTFSKYLQFVQNCFKICPRQALQAKELGFIHPSTNEKCLFEIPLASDLSELIEKWRHYSIHKSLGDGNI